MIEFNQIYDECFKRMQESLDEMIYKEIESAFGINSEGNFTSATACNSFYQPFTEEKLHNAIQQLKPLYDYKADLYKFAMPKYEVKFENDNEMNRFLYTYGMPVVKPTRTITIKVQNRKHRSKRINKKWLKKYGYKEVQKVVPDYGFIGCTRV